MRIYRTQQFSRSDLQVHIFSRDMLDNVSALKGLCKTGTKFCAVVKANAYGHGISEITNILTKADVDFFAVASVYEAIHIKPLVKNQPILIFEPVNRSMSPELVYLCIEKGFHCAIASIDAFEYVSKLLMGTDGKINLHINIETGMGRCGLDPVLGARLAGMIEACPNARLAGLYTHFATADDEDLSYAYRQLGNFNAFLEQHSFAGRKDIVIHASNSAATIKMPEAHFNMVRCGISMYGYYSRPMVKAPVKLKPIMKLQAPVVHLQQIPAGHAVSYGRSYITARETVAAVVPLGYADGYFRCLSNRARMKIDTHIVNVIGRVCMDQLIIDVTDVPNVAVGTMVTIIDNDHDSPCGAYALASLADTICYEILTCVHGHVSRIVH